MISGSNKNKLRNANCGDATCGGVGKEVYQEFGLSRISK
jgi:hypothetical protein